LYPKKLAIVWPDPRPRFASPRGGSRPVFARDDATSSDERTAEPHRILIVEDDFLVAMQMESALREAGFEIVGVAASGEDAIELAVTERPHLVVMDIRLAGDRDGVDTALELFATHGLRCIFATAHHDEHVRRRAAPAGPFGWLQKPYSMASLVRLARQAVDELRKDTH
jgi:two-component system, response regulator PdtaR